MSEDLIKSEIYREWRIDVYKRLSGNYFRSSCYNPRGENVDHLKILTRQ